MKRLLLHIALIALSTLALADNPHVLLTTTVGEIEVELLPDAAPVSVQNFLDYVKRGHYNGTIFHRVIPGFVAQGGGYTIDMHEKPTKAAIQNEAANHLSNVTGTLAMAREAGPHTARAQFYINLADNKALDYVDGMSSRGWGYTVFGRVIRGMDVAKQMASQPTGPGSLYPGMRDVPITPIVLTKARILSANEASPVPADAPNPFPAPAAPATPATSDKPTDTDAGNAMPNDGAPANNSSPPTASPTPADNEAKP